jgi:pimeloyl-ACP methyl ester carboxylesterase
MKNNAARNILYLAIIVNCSTKAIAQDMPFPDIVAVENAQVGEIVIHTDTLQGYTVDYGTLVVAEGENSEKTILLPVVRIHSKNSNPGTPIFIFEGGPGGTNIKLQELPDYLLENHDIVRVGYRGVDGSVSLACPEINKTLKTLPEILSTNGLKEFGQVVTAAAERLARQGIDVAEYAIVNVVDDMETARKAFGYNKVNLSGASFGGAVEYTYCIRYPDSIHRALLTEAAFPFDMPLQYPVGVEKNLNRLNEAWKTNSDCVKQSKDIVQTIRNVMKTLPRSWNGIEIDPDKIKLMTFFGCYAENTTAQAFDAFVAAQDGDYSGLAFMVYFWGNVVDMFNWGDMFSKSYCTATDRTRDLEAALTQGNTTIGSPLSLLAWGPMHYCDWPVKPRPEAENKPQFTGVEALLVYGSADAGRSTKEKYLPYFKNGTIVIHENMGHMDVTALQPEAARHLEKMFFLKGVVDTSLFEKREAADINFVPAQRFGDMAKAFMKQQQK